MSRVPVRIGCGPGAACDVVTEIGSPDLHFGPCFAIGGSKPPIGMYGVRGKWINANPLDIDGIEGMAVALGFKAL